MSCQNFCRYLESQRVSYIWTPHRDAVAAQEVAQVLHISGNKIAKAVLVRADGRVLMAVLPAPLRLNLQLLGQALEARHVELLPEEEVSKFCGDCELGAFPPFGNLYGLETWVDSSLANSDEMVFNAGTHRDAVRITYSDYVKLVGPRTARFAELPHRMFGDVRFNAQRPEQAA